MERHVMDTNKERNALYPGSFDGLTYGHIDIIRRASLLFDRLVVGVAHNPQKKPCFSVIERMTMIEKAIGDLPNVSIRDFDGLTVNFARKIGAKFIVRGLRAISDFEFEIQLALLNRQMDRQIETVFLATSTEYIFLSSSAVKDVILHNGNASDLVPDYVEKALREKLLKKKGEMPCA
ncbi:MAG TPA: pantetheine-phosphate adenylyltransferase [Candidatus Sumerlaeota bacterium]|nr:MAG: Phosphopantetheine adenylyltransferase [candidate division BRC1 bacterium ADurb.Bin183]HOE63648.1 pantetheine-phosphate adenylyltransferase [Candidatus Sumerlaeota bacterium]HRR30661.1 pantetheine-phosphate adenylyltransferase [Candidatus Sumerlaeia bacterium]HON49865.1 pantetheine-phosphate adenylyltransferase [Candidatus Sumerlaeota bacterium]HOR63887.1 pantetheine-phosphate adenylyltransferase [Candidatus Sumerlaeota bacterium]